jgi:hypothetical protein
MEIPIIIVLIISGLSAQTAIHKRQHIRQRIKVKVELNGVRKHFRIIIDKPL